jgi:hypothetical protein
MKFSNPFKRKPCPELDALKERYEEAKKISDPAEKYQQLAGVMADALEGMYKEGHGPIESDRYYKTIGRSNLIAAGLALGAALVFAPTLPAILMVTVVGGLTGGLVLGIGTVEYQMRMNHSKAYSALYVESSHSVAEAEKATTHVAVTQLPTFAEFSRKYPSLGEVFREEARKEKIDALPPDVAAKLLGDAPKPANGKPGLSL